MAEYEEVDYPTAETIKLHYAAGMFYELHIREAEHIADRIEQVMPVLRTMWTKTKIQSRDECIRKADRMQELIRLAYEHDNEPPK